MPRLLHRSTARTQTSANVSVLPCNGMLESSTCWMWFIIVAQQLETSRTRLQHHKLVLLPWSTASSLPPTRMASKRMGRKLNLRRSSTQTRHRLNRSWHLRLESPSWWRQALWSPNTSQVRHWKNSDQGRCAVTEFKSGIKSFTGHLEPLNTQEVVLIRTILVLPALTSRSRFLRVAAELSRDLFGCGSKLWKLWPHLTICGDTIQYTTQYTIQKYNNHVLDIFLTFCTNLLIFLQRYCEDEETRLTSHL